MIMQQHDDALTSSGYLLQKVHVLCKQPLKNMLHTELTTNKTL